MSWDIDRATRRTMQGGAKSKSSCELREDCRRSMYSRRQATTRPATEFLLWRLRAVFKVILVFCAMGLLASPCLAQIPVSPPPPPPPGQHPHPPKQAPLLTPTLLTLSLH